MTVRIEPSSLQQGEPASSTADCAAAPPCANCGGPWLLSALAAGVAVLGCSPGVELEPAKSAHQTALNVADTREAGVLVKARGDVWPGDSEVKEHVTPMQIEIKNHGDQPIQIRYSDISLQSPDGRTFRALAPSDIHGTVQLTVSVATKAAPGAVAAQSPEYVYAGVQPKPPPYVMAFQYYDHLYDNWTAEVPLPTQDMRKMALPEARLEPDGEVSGFVYFERVPPTQATLKIDLVDAGTGALMATAEIPFVAK